MRLAQLSDLHLLEPDFAAKSLFRQLRARFLSVGRSVDGPDRRARFAAGLVAAKAAGFDRLLLSGDLTEEGTAEQLGEVAAVLDEAGIDRARVIAFPGNHDVYSGPSPWPFPQFSEPIDEGPVSLIPVDTTRPQHYLFSAGELRDWERVLGLIDERSKQTIVLLMHHPPQQRSSTFMQFMDGLRNGELVRTALAKYPRLHVIHGHTHTASSVTWPGAENPRIFSPQSVVTGASPLRVYTIDSRGILGQP